MTDPIVQEVRKHRMEHTRKFGGDLTAICADLRTIQAASGHMVVRLSPRRREPSASTLCRVPRRSGVAKAGG
jgi:hypothetical protein